MTFCAGQAILIKGLPFPDKSISEKFRPYLIVKVTDSDLYLLNVSSIGTKEKFMKSLRFENKAIRKFNPPFKLQSFVKMDSLVCVSVKYAKDWHPLDGGKTLDDGELADIVAEMHNRNLWTPFLKIGEDGTHYFKE